MSRIKCFEVSSVSDNYISVCISFFIVTLKSAFLKLCVFVKECRAVGDVSLLVAKSSHYKRTRNISFLFKYSHMFIFLYKIMIKNTWRCTFPILTFSIHCKIYISYQIQWIDLMRSKLKEFKTKQYKFNSIKSKYNFLPDETTRFFKKNACFSRTFFSSIQY